LNLKTNSYDALSFKKPTKIDKPSVSVCNFVSQLPLAVSLFIFIPQSSWAGALDQLITSALQGHPSVLAQRAQLQFAESGEESARWQFYPTPSVSVEAVGTTNSAASYYRGDGHVTTFRLQQPLWTGGKLTAGLEKAEAGVAANTASLDEVRQQIALRVVQTYSDWVSAYLKIQAYSKSKQTHVRLRDQVSRRVEQGVSAESDHILAIGRIDSVTADLSMVTAQRDTALARMAQLLGRTVDDNELSAQFAAPYPLKSDIQAQVDIALTSNPAIQKAQAQAEVQKAAIAERRADLLPEVYLRAEQQFGSYAINNAQPDSRVFVGLSTRLGAGLSTLSNIDGSKAQYQAAVDEIDTQSRTLKEQIMVDYAQARALEGRLVAIRASMEAAAQVSEAYGRQFLAGRKSWLDVMNVTRDLTQSEVQLSDSQATLVLLTWRLAIITQGLSAIVGINQ
jgi:adhesin transport system outer membrane protein